MDLVQSHERAWGNTTYTNRPDLASILQALVVVFWKSTNPEDENKPPTITLHNDLDELENHFSRIIFRSSAGYPDEIVLRIFEGQKWVRVRGVKVLFEKED
jgi:hypothetical protein